MNIKFTFDERKVTLVGRSNLKSNPIVYVYLDGAYAGSTWWDTFAAELIDIDCITVSDMSFNAPFCFLNKADIDATLRAATLRVRSRLTSQADRDSWARLLSTARLARKMSNRKQKREARLAAAMRIEARKSVQ